MRALILIAAPLALSACGSNGPPENAQNIDEAVAAENIVANDVTAIDAVTGDAANMAADVPISSDLGNNLDEMVNAGGPQTPRTRRPGKPPLEQPAPAEAAPTNNAAE